MLFIFFQSWQKKLGNNFDVKQWDLSIYDTSRRIPALLRGVSSSVIKSGLRTPSSHLGGSSVYRASIVCSTRMSSFSEKYFSKNTKIFEKIFGTKNIISLKTPNLQGILLTPSEKKVRSIWIPGLLSVLGVITISSSEFASSSRELVIKHNI